MMLIDILIAAFGTLFIYTLVRYVKSIRQILIFNEVKETILSVTFQYLKKTPDRLLDLSQLKTLALVRLKEYKLTKWVKAIEVTWASRDVIQFIFEFEFSEIHSKYKFVVGIKEIQNNLKDKWT